MLYNIELYYKFNVSIKPRMIDVAENIASLKGNRLLYRIKYFDRWTMKTVKITKR